jgi:hypothetical protein
MPTLTVYPTDQQHQALATLRYRAAAEESGWRIIVGKEGLDTVYPERVREADVVLIARDFPRFFAGFQAVVTEARQWGKPVLYDLDDLLPAMPTNHPTRGDYKDALGGIMYAVIEADQLVVSTPLLRKLLLPLQPNIAIWPTLLPDSLWKIRSPQPPTTAEPLIIGYMGGISHIPDLEMLTAVLQRVLDQWGNRVEIRFWGCPPPAALVGHPQVHQITPGIKSYADFAQLFNAEAQADIWLAPLKPGLFNDCKSAIKFWEYSAIGGVGVYSRLEPYEDVVQDGENGLLAGSDEEWFSAITTLAESPELRARLAQKAQAKLRQEGLLSTHLHRWQEIYNTAVSHPQTATSPTRFAHMIRRYSELVQQRSDERHQEALASMHDTQTLLRTLQEQSYLLQERSKQLEAILQNPRWRTWQRLKKIAKLDFSSLPPHEPFADIDSYNQ